MIDKFLKNSVTVIASVFILLACTPWNSNKIELKLIQTPTDTWGYCICHHNKIIIYQEYIPCIQGNVPFSSKSEAKAVGELVLSKIKNNKMPACTKNELVELGVIPFGKMQQE